MNGAILPSGPAAPILSVSALNVAFRGTAGEVQVVRDIAFQARRGESFFFTVRASVSFAFSAACASVMGLPTCGLAGAGSGG